MEKRLESLKVSDELTLLNGSTVMRVHDGYVVEVLQSFGESVLLTFSTVSAVLKWLRRK